MTDGREALQEQIIALAELHSKKRLNTNFIPGETYIPASGSTMEAEEVKNVIECILSGWVTEGKYAKEFSRGLRQYLNMRFVTLCNSGSSANLLAVTAATQKELGDKRAKPGDEFITAAVGFPTTVSALIQNRITPVFVDIDPKTLTPDPDLIEQAVVEGKTKGIILAHTLGSPFNVDAIRDICNEYGLMLIEDCCDALGSRYNGELVGTQGTMSTLSFFPAHHITMGQGGAVFTNDGLLKKLIDSLGAWGRGCWCKPGDNNTCGKRFDYCIGDNIEYDHKYIFDRLGYNLQITDLQAAIGVAQLGKIGKFEERRKDNWKKLREALDEFHRFFLLPEPLPNADPSWFGFHMTVKASAPFTRSEITQFLENRRIGTRMLFGGNLLHQPAFHHVPHKVFGTLLDSDALSRGAFWIGTHQGIDERRLGYIVDTFREFGRKYA
jgi:CDP-6-deoxy-D-xylo-4-hexulose-3-dehydrase